MGLCGCPISIAIPSSITSFFENNSVSPKNGTYSEEGVGKEKAEDKTGNHTDLRHLADTDNPNILTVTKPSQISSDPQSPKLHEVKTSSDNEKEIMSSDTGSDVNRNAENDETLSSASDDSKRRRISIPSDPSIDADVPVNDDTNDCEEENTQITPGGTKKRRVSFVAGFNEEVHQIPDLNEYDTENIKDDLFYSDADYERFRASEQRRYDKMVAKRLQKMVMEKIQPSINEAVANGATLEDIEAMVPKTHEEMVAYMGGQENIRKLLEESSFSKLNKNEEKPKTIRSSRSSIVAKSAPTLSSDIENEVENNVSDENESNNKKAENKVLATTRKRTIRSSRSSIEITSKNMAGRLSNAEADAAAASQELMAMIAEEDETEENPTEAL